MANTTTNKRRTLYEIVSNSPLAFAKSEVETYTQSFIDAYNPSNSTDRGKLRLELDLEFVTPFSQAEKKANLLKGLSNALNIMDDYTRKEYAEHFKAKTRERIAEMTNPRFQKSPESEEKEIKAYQKKVCDILKINKAKIKARITPCGLQVKDGSYWATLGGCPNTWVSKFPEVTRAYYQIEASKMTGADVINQYVADRRNDLAGAGLR